MEIFQFWTPQLGSQGGVQLTPPRWLRCHLAARYYLGQTTKKALKVLEGERRLQQKNGNPNQLVAVKFTQF